MDPLGIGLYTYHKYRKSIDSQVPLDGDGNPISDEDPEGGGVALDLGYVNVNENTGYNAEGEQSLALSTLPSSGAHNAVRAPLFNALSLRKAEPLSNAGLSRSNRRRSSVVCASR